MGTRPAARLGGGLRSCAASVVALLGILVLGGLPGCGGSSHGADRIVLVTIDTLRADRVGAYGDLGARTPVLDQIAAQGIRFEHAIAPTPLTLPSHASLMTGRPPPEHGVRHNSVFAVGPDVPLLAERLNEAGYATGAFVAAFVLDGRYGLSRGFDVYDDDMGQRRASANPFSFAERRADEVVDAALSWLDEAPDRFFLWVHLYDPHADYDPPPRYRDLLPGDPYAGEIAFADHQVGRLLQRVWRRWGSEGLVVAVTSDHGESLGEHNERTHSYSIYDATQRVPLLLMGPKIPAGRVVEAPVRLIDVAPTLLWFAGLDSLDGARGRNLVPLLHGGEEEPRLAYVETLATQIEMGWSPLLGIRTPAHKYIRAPQPELYDLAADPGETRNLALEQPGLVRELDAVLEERLRTARPLEASVDLTAEDRARLQSLGYVAPGDDALTGSLGEVGGLNPRDHMLEAMRVLDARTALGEGRAEEALALLENVQSPGRSISHVRAQAALAADRAELAVEIMERLTHSRADARDLILLGQAYLTQGRRDEAREAFESAREADPQLDAPLAGLARVASQEGDFEAADRWLREAEALAPRPETLRVDRAVLRLHQGRLDEAEALLAGVGREILTEPDRALRLAHAEHTAGRPDRARRLLRQALAERPAHPKLRSAYAVQLAETGRTEEALVIWRQAHAEDPEDPGARNDLAWGLALAGQELDRALELAREAARELGDAPAVLDTLATVHLARGEAGAALRVAEEGLAGEAGPVRPHLLYVRAAALVELGRDDEAREALRALRAEASELGPPWDERVVALERRLGLGSEFPPVETTPSPELGASDAARAREPGGIATTGGSRRTRVP